MTITEEEKIPTHKKGPVIPKRPPWPLKGISIFSQKTTTTAEMISTHYENRKYNVLIFVIRRVGDIELKMATLGV